MTRLGSHLGLSGEHDGLTVADIRHPDAVETTIAGIHRAGELPVVTCALEDAEEVRRHLTYAQVRYPGLRACLEPVPGGPLAVGVLSSLVDDISDGEIGLAWQLNALDRLKTLIWSATWLPTVTGLRSPGPSLLQHAASWMPGSGFLAEHHPAPRLVKASKPPLTGLEARQDAALLHTSSTRDTWVTDAVRQALQPQSTSEVSTVRAPVDAHGSDRAIEFVTVPLTYHSDARPSPESIVDCAGCGTRHARRTCPVCGMQVVTEDLVESAPEGEAE